MGRIAIVVYKPLPSKEEELEALVKEHFAILAKEQLVSDRKPVIMRASGGDIIEVFECKSAGAIEQAHSNPSIQKLWERFSNVCTYETAANVPEFQKLFSEFESID